MSQLKWKGEFKPVRFKCTMCGDIEILIHHHPTTARKFCENCKRRRNATKNREKYKKEVKPIMKKASTKSKQKPVAKKAVKTGKY